MASIVFFLKEEERNKKKGEKKELSSNMKVERLPISEAFEPYYEGIGMVYRITNVRDGNFL